MIHRDRIWYWQIYNSNNEQEKKKKQRRELSNLISKMEHSFSGGGSYPSAELQSVYSTASANWIKNQASNIPEE